MRETRDTNGYNQQIRSASHFLVVIILLFLFFFLLAAHVIHIRILLNIVYSL